MNKNRKRVIIIFSLFIGILVSILGITYFISTDKGTTPISDVNTHFDNVPK